MRTSGPGRRKGPAAGKVRRASLPRIASPQREVLLRLDHLRSATREIARSYLANLEHDIIELRETVGSATTPDGQKATLRAIDRMGDVLDDLALKPHKGRRSDLKKVEKTIRALQRMIAKRDAEPGSDR
jgi:hypothetical protein